VAPSDAEGSKRYGRTREGSWRYAYACTDSGDAEFVTTWHAPANATTDEKRRRHSRDDENLDAKSGGRPSRFGGNATHDEPGRWAGWPWGIGWRNTKYE